jgi:hypothetical protein
LGKFLGFLNLKPGTNDIPIIYHGHTLTSKILFEDVIIALKEHAFISNPYPIVLSFEVHCSEKVQHTMALILKKHIKD